MKLRTVCADRVTRRPLALRALLRIAVRQARREARGDSRPILRVPVDAQGQVVGVQHSSTGPAGARILFVYDARWPARVANYAVSELRNKCGTAVRLRPCRALQLAEILLKLDGADAVYIVLDAWQHPPEYDDAPHLR